MSAAYNKDRKLSSAQKQIVADIRRCTLLTAEEKEAYIAAFVRVCLFTPASMSFVSTIHTNISSCFIWSSSYQGNTYWSNLSTPLDSEVVRRKGD